MYVDQAELEKLPASRPKVLLSVAIAVVWGALVALQARINGELGTRLSDGFLAALISFSSGLVIVSIGLGASRGGRAGIRRVREAIRSRELPWWFVCGGLAGGLFVLSQGLTVGIIGVALFTVAAVAGQTLSGLIIDARGIGTVAPKRVTLGRALGAAIALIAVVVSVGQDFRIGPSVWLLLMPLVVGLLLGWQQAVNGQVKSLAGSAVTATFINFVGGTVLLLVVAVIHTSIVGLPRSLPSAPYLYLGGLIGVIFIAGFAVITPIIGVLLQSLAAVSGQLIMSLVLGILAPTSTAALEWTTVFGTVLALVGVVIATIPSRRARISPTTAQPADQG